MVRASILGAGVAGLCCAAELTRRGVQVRLIDPNGGAGAHGCSWWAGGMLAPQCEGEHAPEAVARLGKLAPDWWAEFTPVSRRGTLVVAPGRDRAELARFSQLTDGWEHAKAAELEPDLHGFDEALFFKDEAHLDPRQALHDLQRYLHEHGVEITRDAAPEGQIIDCRGLAARDVLCDLRGVRGEMLVLRSRDIDLSRPARLLHPRMPLYVVPRGEGLFMLGATMIETEDRAQARARSILELLSAAYTLTPGFAEAEVVEIGVDLRPAFADNLPRVRQKDGVIYVNGLYRHGYLMAPALAQCVADFLTDNKQSELFDENYS